MKASIAGELILLVGLVALAYLLYLQQDQLVTLELELDKVRGSLGTNLPPVPVASDNGAEALAGNEPPPPPPPRPRTRRRSAGA